MAKKYATHVSNTALIVTTSSCYGSHKSMVVRDMGEKVICKDDRGEYETYASRIDSGLADPARNSSKRFE
jgi:hypothetical protein